MSIFTALLSRGGGRFGSGRWPTRAWLLCRLHGLVHNNLNAPSSDGTTKMERGVRPPGGSEL
jgi:hypothetical protein